MGSTTGLLNLDQVAELLELPIVLVLKRIDDGRLPHVVVEGRTMSRREHVMALKARQDRQDALMKRLHAELAELELGRPMTLLERAEANAAAIRTMGRRAMEDGFRNGVAAYYMDREQFGDGIVKEHPDGERELIALEGREEVVIRTVPDAVAEFERLDGTPFEIPRAWWHEAGMDGFIRTVAGYRSDCSEKLVLRLDAIVAARREPGVVLDHGGSRRDRMVRALQGIAHDEPMPPVKVRRTADGLCWELHDGYDRYCASLAVGFEEIAVVEAGRS